VIKQACCSRRHNGRIGIIPDHRYDAVHRPGLSRNGHLATAHLGPVPYPGRDDAELSVPVIAGGAPGGAT
jgi:hypothetical protein